MTDGVRNISKRKEVVSFGTQSWEVHRIKTVSFLLDYLKGIIYVRQLKGVWYSAVISLTAVASLGLDCKGNFL